MGDCLLDGIHRLDREDIIQILCAVISFRGGNTVLQYFAGSLISPQFHRFRCQCLCQNGKEPLSHSLVDHQRLAGIAYADPLCLCIENDLCRHLQVSRLINIHMTVAGAGLDHGDGAVLHHACDQSGTSPGNEKIHILLQLHKLYRRTSVGIGDQLQYIRPDSKLFDCFPQYLYNGLIGVDRIASAL